MSTNPNVILLYGNDEYAMSRRLKEFEAVFSDETTAGMNVSRLDARTMSAADLYNAVNSLPFLADHRLVLLSNPSKRYVARKPPKKAPAQAGSLAVDPNLASGEDDEAVETAEVDQEPQEVPTEARGKFLELLAAIPPTTRLVISEFMELTTKKDQAAAENHWLVKWIKKAGQGLERFALPSPTDMKDWILKEAKAQGGQIGSQAAERLADLVGGNTRQSMQEITKLLTYVNWGRPINLADVEALTPRTGEANIWKLVEAVSEQNGRTAQQLLHQFIDADGEFYVWAMIIRQFRLMLLAREVLDGGGGQAQAEQALQVSEYPAKNALAGAQRFTLPLLEKIYRRLLEIDLAAKTGRMPLDLGMELLVVELAGHGTLARAPVR